MTRVAPVVLPDPKACIYIYIYIYVTTEERRKPSHPTTSEEKQNLDQTGKATKIVRDFLYSRCLAQQLANVLCSETFNRRPDIAQSHLVKCRRPAKKDPRVLKLPQQFEADSRPTVLLSIPCTRMPMCGGGCSIKYRVELTAVFRYICCS